MTSPSEGDAPLADEEIAGLTAIEAVRACEFWTTNVAEIGSTRDRRVGEALNGIERVADSVTGALFWGITVPRWLRVGVDDDGRPVLEENEVYLAAIAEIEARRSDAAAA